MPNSIENIIIIAIIVAIFYFFFKLLHSIFKSLSIVLIIIVLVVLFKSMREPVEILGIYKVDNLKIERIKWKFYL